jgi:hypothetical protein
MAGRTRAELPPDLAHGRQRFQAWRRARQAGTRIPQTLWDLARQLAQRHGVSRTAAALRLDYYALQKRLAAAEPSRPPAPTFLELPAAALAAPAECVRELQDGAGARLRLVLQGYDATALAALGRTLWEAERCCKSPRR